MQNKTSKKHSASIRPITETDTDKIVKWRNAPSVMEHFIYRTPLTAEGHLNWYRSRVQTGQVAQFMITDNETGEEVGSVYLRDIDPVNKKCEYGVFIGEDSCRGKGIAKAVIYEALNRAKDLGAKKAYVISDMDFYGKLGFEKEYRFSFYWKKPLIVNGADYHIVRLLGKGKGGYSYLAHRNDNQVVLKQIHHEPCDYYTFGNKIEAERDDYERLKNAGIRIPQMLDIDLKNKRIVKEYIDGDTIFDLVKNGESVEIFLPQVKEMADLAKAAGLNIDYFPTNFVVHDGLLWYIDYECNNYMDEWNFANWGVKYWSRTPEFEEYLNNH